MGDSKERAGFGIQNHNIFYSEPEINFKIIIMIKFKELLSV